MPRSLTIYTDGSARNLPNNVLCPARIGLFVIDTNEKFALHIGNATSNQAEYQAIIAALRIGIVKNVHALTIRTDSEICYKQIRQKVLGLPGYGCTHGNLIPLLEIVSHLAKQIPLFNIEWIPRERNIVADDLTKEAREKPAVKPPSEWTDKDITQLLESGEI